MTKTALNSKTPFQRAVTFCFRIGRAAGIDIRLHWSFFLAPLYIYFEYRELGTAIVSLLLVLMLAVYVCILLHEYGHALAARYFGIKTKDIIITPIGGLARLVRMPIQPMQELLITIAGPAVNLVIAGLFFCYLALNGESLALANEEKGIAAFPQVMMWANIVLFLFNLIPAFPMDGGRILRSGLAFFLDHRRATKVAVIVGRILALVFIATAVAYGDVMLGIVGAFVFMAAGMESAAANAAVVSESRYEEPEIPFQ